MYIDSKTTTINNKTYKSILLRRSYWKDGKTRKETIANLNHCTEAEIKAIKLALASKENLENVVDISKSYVEQGKSYGAVLLLDKLLKRTGIKQALGNSYQGKLAALQIIGRIMLQGSRLSLSREYEDHVFSELLELPEEISEQELYKNLSWLAENQKQIEKNLQKINNIPSENNLFLYDVTSSYLEGTQNELAEFGYNRDGKKGKKQIVIGLLTNKDGLPIATRVFEGNTADSKTVQEQIKILKDEFQIATLTLVGDRVMFPKVTIENLPKGFSYITAIRKKQMETLLKEEVIQMELFDTEIQEIEYENARYIMRCNPIRKQEIENTREEKLKKIQKKIKDKNQYLEKHTKAKPEIALKNLEEELAKLDISSFTKLNCTQRSIALEINHAELEEISKLDGCYCIKTDVLVKEVSKETIHARYKDLALVESAFRVMKQNHLEIRPLYLRRADRTRAHVLVIMLSYIVQRELKALWKDVECTVQENIAKLTKLTTATIRIGNVEINKLTKPNKKCKTLLKLAKVAIPLQIGESVH